MAKKAKKVYALNTTEVEGVAPENLVTVTPSPADTRPDAEILAEAEVAEKPLTKRTRTATSTMLEASGKAVNVRTPHTAWTWEVLAKILPATAAECVAALEQAVAEPGVKEKCGGLNSHVNYYVRRGWLKAAE